MRSPFHCSTLTATVIGSAVTSSVEEAEPRLRVTSRREAPCASPKLEVVEQPRHPFELDTVASHWQLALDAAQSALGAAAGELSAADLGARRRGLAEERKAIAELLAHLARATGVRPAPWLSNVPVTREMLGVPSGVRACLFDLEGVLTDSGVLHASAWAEVFDDFLLHLGDTTDRHFERFDPDADYRTFVEGRPRLEGVHAFLSSRGIRVPEGRPGDPARARTANGIANHKRDVLRRRLRGRSVIGLSGARRYLEAAGHAGLARAAVSASASTLPMLELAGLATLVEQRVDADVIRAEGLRSRPAADLVLAACRRLGVPPEQSVTFTSSPAGVAAGRAAGVSVIGVGDRAQAEVLRGFGAERVVPSLSALLDSRLAESR
jgi:HAD superfamily hydrolase (TIGR01509 family)